jgi:hypothetical protein
MIAGGCATPMHAGFDDKDRGCRRSEPVSAPVRRPVQMRICTRFRHSAAGGDRPHLAVRPFLLFSRLVRALP